MSVGILSDASERISVESKHTNSVAHIQRSSKCVVGQATTFSLITTTGLKSDSTTTLSFKNENCIFGWNLVHNYLLAFVSLLLQQHLIQIYQRNTKNSTPATKYASTHSNMTFSVFAAP